MFLFSGRDIDHVIGLEKMLCVESPSTNSLWKSALTISLLIRREVSSR